MNEFRPKSERITDFSKITEEEPAKDTAKPLMSPDNPEDGPAAESAELTPTQQRQESMRARSGSAGRYSLHRQMSLQNTPC